MSDPPLKQSCSLLSTARALSQPICAIVDCAAAVAPTPELPDSMTCASAEHKAVETTHRLRGQSRFQLRMCLQCAQIAHPNDAVAKEVEDFSAIADDEHEDEYEIIGDAPLLPSPTSNQPHQINPKPRKLHAQFGRRRTHNEELFVAPCGMILARETFFSAEGVASVIIRSPCYIAITEPPPLSFG
jgi:hypothetical protein